MKTPPHLEHQALTLLEFLQTGGLAQGSGLETAFAKWPGPPGRAASLLAAHANAARGREILWLVGTRQAAAGKRTNPGVLPSQFETWITSLLPFFDGLVPHVQSFVIAREATPNTATRKIVALQIETVRAPFVVRTNTKSKVFGVPWWDHDAKSIRSATRSDLIRLLVPLQDLPQFEVLEADLTFYKNAQASGGSKITHRWTLDGSLYVIPKHDTPCVIPLHRCRAGISAADGSFAEKANDFTLTADKQSSAVRISESAALIEGVGRMFFYCSGATAVSELSRKSQLTLSFDLLPAGFDRAAVVQTLLQPAIVTESNQAARWKL